MRFKIGCLVLDVIHAKHRGIIIGIGPNHYKIKWTTGVDFVSNPKPEYVHTYFRVLAEVSVLEKLIYGVDENS